MSKAVKLMSERELTEVLDVSIKWNETHNLTGMLLYVEGQFINYNGGRFIQVIEGNEDDVKEIFKSIRTDAKHSNVILLNDGQIKLRNFDTWSMGFQFMTYDAYRKLPGCFELNDEVFDYKKQKQFNSPITFLRSFYHMNKN